MSYFPNETNLQLITVLRNIDSINERIPNASIDLPIQKN